MPDLRPVETFTSQMRRLEARYLKELQQPLKETRLILLEALLQDPSGLAAVARREFGALYGRITAVASGFASPLEELALILAERQFDLVSHVGAQTTSFDLARQSTAGRRQGLLLASTQGATAWLDMLQAQFLVELSRLRAADELPQAIADRLLAEEIASGRVSIWRTGNNLAALESQRSLWEASSALTGVLYQAGQSQTGERWRKQAVAVIAKNTTDCCLRVHGQIQDLDAPFELEGTPRYADEQQHPPFHDFCRTVESLWVEKFETAGVTTGQMRDAARAELTAREDGSRQGISPAHATSRRE
jgi:hypothetical protein